MSHAGTEDVGKHVGIYIKVFLGLMALTVVTVVASYFRLAIPVAITVALIIATLKGSLVASFFMHLIEEKKVIYAVLILTGVFFLALMLLPLLGYFDRIRY